VSARIASARLRRRSFDGLALAVLAAATLVMIFPILIILSTSFKQPADVAAGTLVLFRPTWENYLALVGIVPSEFHFDLMLHFRNSILAAAGSTALAVLLGTPAAYAFARVRFRGRVPAMLFLLLMRLLPPIATVIPLFLIMRTLHLLDTVLGLVLAYSSFNLPFFIWIMYSFFVDLPKDIEDAARIDGATGWQAFARVMLPLSRPGLVAASIFAMIMAWNDFLFAVTLTGREAATLPLLIAGFITDVGVSWGTMMAAGSIIVVPVLLFAIVTQQHLVRGMTAGAMKD
jgi:ABC-type glycerol-3-phosphate transport system permease component